MGPSAGYRCCTKNTLFTPHTGHSGCWRTAKPAALLSIGTVGSGSIQWLNDTWQILLIRHHQGSDKFLLSKVCLLLFDRCRTNLTLCLFFVPCRKALMKNKLIMVQPFIQKIDGANATGQLLHLPRFYIEFKPKYVLLTEKIIEILKTRPNCMSEYGQIKAHFDLPLHDTIRKLFKMANFTRFVATDLVIFDGKQIILDV